jgi:multimeric flavodoxin WrbA
MPPIDIRKGMPDVHLTRQQYEARFRDLFYDPDFEPVASEIARVIDVAWKSYDDYHKSPRKRRAGEGFANPDYEAPIEWLATREAILAAQRRQADPASPARILLINGSMRTDQSCPGEMSKSWRLAQIAQAIVAAEQGFECELLDLSRLTSEYGRQIHPCKACVSTAQPLCHWPCSCYPNYAMGQIHDWMNEIYPMWVAAHGVMIITPVNWYQAPSGLKAMIDRLVCADGGNPDLTSTEGKTVATAKQLELAGWPYPRHLAGRLFAVVAHGDTAGAENLSRILTDWLEDMHLRSAGPVAELDSYVGYYRPYATSHQELDTDQEFQIEVGNAARSLIAAVKLMRSGELAEPGKGLREPRPK